VKNPIHQSTDPKRTQRLTLNATEAANVIGVSPRLLWSLTNRGEVPHVRIGRRIVYPIAAIEAWLAARAKGGAE